MTEVRDKEEWTHDEIHYRREWYRLHVKRRRIVLSRLKIARGNGLFDWLIWKNAVRISEGVLQRRISKIISDWAMERIST